MKKALLAMMGVLAMGVSPLQAQNPYQCTFEPGSYAEIHPAAAPAGWLHYADRGSSTDVFYQINEEGGHDGGSYLYKTDKCNPYYATNDCMVTPAVKGEVSFWVKGKRLELYKMSLDGARLTKGTSVSLPAGFAISESEWQQVTLTFDTYTRLGILLRSAAGGIDDFEAADRDETPYSFSAIGNITYDSKAVADVTGKAEINVAFDVYNGSWPENTTLSNKYLFGKTNYSGDEITDLIASDIEGATELAVGAVQRVECKVPYTLANPSVTESFTLGVADRAVGAVSKIGSVKVTSAAGILEVKDGTTTVKKDAKVECGLQTAPYTHSLKLSNTGEGPITITDVYFDGALEDVLSAQLPVTVEPGANGLELPLEFGPEAHGGLCDVVTLVYSDGVTQDNEFTFTLSAGLAAEDDWTEDFQSIGTGTIPTGWLVTEGSYRTTKPSTYEPPIVLSSDSYNKSAIVTSLMHFDPAKTLTLMAGRQGTDTSAQQLLTIWISPDREEWTELGGILNQAPAGRLPFNTFVATGAAKELQWFNFSLRNVAIGDYYVKFEATKAYLDNIFGLTPAVPVHDMLLNSFTAPLSGEVNKLLTATVEVRNMKADAESDYTVTLFENDTPVAHAAGTEVAGYATEKISLTYMPHTAGDCVLRAVVDIAEGFRTLSSADVSVAVAAEECVGRVETAMVDKFSSSGLVGAKFNKMQWYIPAEQIQMPAGTEIAEVELAVYNSSSYSAAEFPVTLWVEEVEDVIPFTNDDKTDFALPEAKPTATGTFVIAANTGSATAPAKMIIALNEPVVYNGKALRLTWNANLSSSIWSFYHGVHTYDDNLCRTYGKNTETGTYPGASVSKDAPAVTLRYALEAATVSGRIINKGNPVEGVAVTLTETAAEGPARLAPQVAHNAAQVAYSATTGEDGTFSIPVVKSDRTYTLTATKDSEINYSHPTTVSLAGANVEMNDIEVNKPVSGVDDATTATVSISGRSITVDGTNGCVYNTAGVKVATLLDGSTISLEAGIYIVRIDADAHARRIIIR